MISIAILLLTYPLAKLLVLPKIILEGTRLWIHEFGHSVIAWLGGIAATPLPFGWSNMGEDRALFVHVCLFFLLGAMAYYAYLAERWYWVFMAGALCILKLYFSWGLSIDRLKIAIVYGGVGGEFFFSAFLWCAAFHRFTDSEDAWKVIRYCFLIVAAYALCASTFQWLDISKGRADIPFGSLIHGEEDTGGDMNQLLDMAGWTRKELIQMYLTTMRWSWAAIILHTLYFSLVALFYPPKKCRLR